MHFTYFVGNGFDLAFGLKTKFMDFLPNYISQTNSSSSVQRFKNFMRDDINHWSDFEAKLGEITSEYSPDEALLFREALIDFTKEFSIYLRQEEAKIKIKANKEEISNRIYNGFIHFEEYLRPVQKSQIERIYSINSDSKYTYSFINFNYTFLLDNSVKLLNDSSVLYHTAKNQSTINDSITPLYHIHGTYDQSMLLGVNDIDQIQNKAFIKTYRLTNLFVKPQANKFSKQGIHEKCEQLINRSNIIVIFGMSIGKTDAIWWQTIINWLLKDASRQLVIFLYKEGINPTLRDSFTDCVEDTYDLLKNYGLNDTRREIVEDRLHIVLENYLLGTPLVK